MLKYILVFLVAISFIVYKALYMDNNATPQANTTNVFHLDGNITATFDMKDTDGNSFKVLQYNDQFITEGYDNKVLIFNFFGTFCPGCKAEIPMLSDLKDKYGEKIQIVGVSVDKGLTIDQLKEFKDDMGANFSMSVGTDRLRALMCDTLPEGSCHGIPLTVVYSEGKLQTFKEGFGNDLSYIESIISSVEKKQ